MKISRICALVLVMVAAAGLVFADGINDPKVIIHGVNGGGIACGPHNCQGVGLNFSFTIPQSGKGFLYFTNTSGKNWTSLTLVVDAVGINPSNVSCTQSFFLNCTAQTLKNGFLEIQLSGIRGGLNPRNGTTVGGHAGAAPEPGTVALMATGLAGLFSRRKYWRNRFNL